MKITRKTNKNYSEKILVDGEIVSTSSNGRKITIDIWSATHSYAIQFSKEDIVRMLKHMDIVEKSYLKKEF